MFKEFQKFTEQIALNKGLTKKTTERLVINLIEEPAKLKTFLSLLQELQDKWSLCPVCFGLLFESHCSICEDPARNHKIICVVASISDLLNIEKCQKFQGVYAVLGGEINLVKNIGPEQLKIAEFLNRANSAKEVILALNATFEGEVTANYLLKKIGNPAVKITRIAKGIPMGGMLDYIDENTLENALRNRKNVKEI